MATTEELIRQAQILPLSAESDDKCVIDPETREITVPERYRLLGVESDEKVERIEFRCPKIVGDSINLSQLQIRVNYQNANGEKDQYIVTDLESDIENITFSWLLSRKVTAYQGEVRFIICAVKISGESITNEWNTTLAEAQVLQGLEVDTPEPSEEQSDVIAQLLQIMKDTSDQAVEAVEFAETTAKQTIQDYTNQMKATIPEDYTDLVQKVDILERTKAPAIHQTAAGNPITLTDAAEGTPVVDFAMDGKTEQVQTTGAQLFDASNIATKTQGNVTITNNGDGSFTVTGSGTLTQQMYTNADITGYAAKQLFKAGRVKLSQSNINPYCYMSFRNSDDILGDVDSKSHQYFDLTDDMINSDGFYVRFGFMGKEGENIVSGTMKPMIYIDGDGTWEPYTGGHPSPSPEYPQEIVNAGKYNEDTQKWEHEVSVGGANLINILEAKTPQGEVPSNITNNGFDLENSDSNSSGRIVYIPVDLKKGKQYVIKIKADSKVSTYLPGLNQYGIKYGSAFIPKDNTNKIALYVDRDVYGTFSVSDIMLNEGSEPLPYESYRTPQNVLIQSERPLTKWDRLEKRNGQWGWVFKSGTKRLTGDKTEPFTIYNNPAASQDNVGFVLTISDMLPNARMDGYCNNFIPINTPAVTYPSEGVTFGPNSRDFYVLMLKSRGITDVESFNTWLKAHNMTIWYPTAEETFVPLTEPEQSALEALTTYFPTTIITNDADCEMEIEYVADTKKYIDDKFAELAQNLAATQNTLLEV